LRTVKTKTDLADDTFQRLARVWETNRFEIIKILKEAQIGH
jgi:hypothetical protein